MEDGLSDLDALVLRCRGDAARMYIHEAVACYKSGAFRSSIVATWIAVLYDFLEKLRELEMSGDAAAKAKLEQFEGARASGNWKASLQFELDLLQSAQNEFELLSPLQAVDLKRLSEDRNRCAHPSMSSSSEPYRATAELARSHIKNAVIYLLEQPPVQGKAAFDRIVKDIHSEYFPRETERAVEFFRAGPLARARLPLVRNLIIAISKQILSEVLTVTNRARLFAALNAIVEMYRAEAESVLRDLLPRLVSAQEDKRFYRVIFFVARVPGAWGFLGNAGQIKSASYVEECEDEDARRFLPYAVQVPALKELAHRRLENASVETLARVISANKSSEYADVAISRFRNAGSFRAAEKLFEELVMPLAESLDAAHAREVVIAFSRNIQISYAARIPGLYVEFFKRTARVDNELRPDWEKMYEGIRADKELASSYGALASALKKRFGF